MRKLLIVAMLALVSFAVPAKAQVVTPTPAVYVGPTSPLPVWPFLGAVTAAVALVILEGNNATFPPCNVFKCEYTYPSDRNGM